MTCLKRKDFVHDKLVDVVTNSVSFVGATGIMNPGAPAKMVDFQLFYVTVGCTYLQKRLYMGLWHINQDGCLNQCIYTYSWSKQPQNSFISRK
jgi:hypothetical protein